MHHLVSKLLFALALAVLICPSFLEASWGAKETEWTNLFDGKTTEGWRGYREKAFPEIGWDIEDGALHRKKGESGGDLVTEEQFENFELRFEWKVAPNANSGVMYRVAETNDYSFETGPEYQVLDDNGHPDGEKGETSAASLYALVAPEGKTLKPVGEWNEARIIHKGNHVEHWLNGKKVVEIEIGGDDWNKRMSESKFNGWTEFAKSAKGHIALQDHGDEVWYRSFKIRELAD